MRYFIFFFLIFSHEAFAEEVTASDWRDGVVESVQPVTQGQPINNDDVIQGTALPVPTPSPARPPVVQTPDGERDWQNGQPADFSGVNRSVTTAPIWEAFTDIFSRCAPGCAPRNVGTWGQRGGRSCHPTGNAVDLGGMRCNGTNYTAYDRRFAEFVQCVQGKSFNGRRWKSLYRETHVGRSRDCSRSNRNQTLCHWDHVHLSLGCAASSI